MEKTRNSITFNPFLKAKLHVLAGCMLQAGDNAYADTYRNYRHRLENHPAHQGKSKGHRHNMAMRYIKKRFLADLWRVWRTQEGLPTPPEYHEGKLGHQHDPEAPDAQD